MIFIDTFIAFHYHQHTHNPHVNSSWLFSHIILPILWNLSFVTQGQWFVVNWYFLFSCFVSLYGIDEWSYLVFIFPFLTYFMQHNAFELHLKSPVLQSLHHILYDSGISCGINRLLLESSSLHHRKWYWHLESMLQGDGSGDSANHYDSFVCWVYPGRISQMRPEHFVIFKWAISALELKITDQSKSPLL